MLEEENTKIININDANSNFESEGAIEGEVVLEGEPLVESMSEYFDNQNHELFINAVRSTNSIVEMYKVDAIFKTMVVGAFAFITLYNTKSILVGENDLGFLNYVAAFGGVTGFVMSVIYAVRSIKKIINMSSFMNYQNKYVTENYPEEARMAKVPRKFQKLYKKRKNNKNES